MERLFEAKATFNDQLISYNIFRLGTDQYKATLMTAEDANFPTSAPAEILIEKKAGQWQSSDQVHKELSATLSIEIDVFNNGYGDLLGRIGQR